MASPIYSMMFCPKYEKLIDEDSRSSNEHTMERDPRARRLVLDYRAGLFVVSGVYILSMVLVLVASLQPHIFHGPSIYRMAEIPHDHQVVFIPERDFEIPDAGLTANDPWGKLLPPGRGFIEIPVSVTLPDGRTEIRKQQYCISMFHQLHCIAGLKAAFESKANDDSMEHKEHMAHLAHCFDYLRQAVMCAGDASLETAVVADETGVKGVDGWGVTHQCRNYEMIYEFAERNRYLNSSGIL